MYTLDKHKYLLKVIGYGTSCKIILPDRQEKSFEYQSNPDGIIYNKSGSTEFIPLLNRCKRIFILGNLYSLCRQISYSLDFIQYVDQKGAEYNDLIDLLDPPEQEEDKIKESIITLLIKQSVLEDDFESYLNIAQDNNIEQEFLLTRGFFI